MTKRSEVPWASVMEALSLWGLRGCSNQGQLLKLISEKGRKSWEYGCKNIPGRGAASLEMMVGGRRHGIVEGPKEGLAVTELE